MVPRYMLVPRDTVRSMHKVMRFVHGLRYWLAGLGCWVCLGSLLAGFFARAYPPIPCRALMWLYVWFAGFFVSACGCPGCYSLTWCASKVMRFLHSLSCMRWVLLCQCVSGSIPCGFFVCVFGHVWACLGMVPLCIPLCKPLMYPLPYPLYEVVNNMA